MNTDPRKQIERHDESMRHRLSAVAEEMFARLEAAVPGGVGQAEWPAWRSRAEEIVERVIGPTCLHDRVASDKPEPDPTPR